MAANSLRLFEAPPCSTPPHARCALRRAAVSACHSSVPQPAAHTPDAPAALRSSPSHRFCPLGGRAPAPGSACGSFFCLGCGAAPMPYTGRPHGAPVRSKLDSRCVAWRAGTRHRYTEGREDGLQTRPVVRGTVCVLLAVAAAVAAASRCCPANRSPGSVALCYEDVQEFDPSLSGVVRRSVCVCIGLQTAPTAAK